jgi:hypothetical protein
MELSDYRTIVRGLLVDTDYDQTLIDQALNWSVYELCNNNRLRIMEASDTVTASQGDTVLEFPSDMMTLIREGFYATVPQVVEMNNNFVEYGNFMKNYANFATANQQRASMWTDFGNQARFSAPLNADHTFQVDYLRVPTPMEDDGDACEIPDRYSELVSKMGLARIMEINEDYAEAQQERQNFAPLMTTFIRNEARGGFKTGGTVMRQGRSRNPYRADKDF